jgi:hypothetical protein
MTEESRSSRRPRRTQQAQRIEVREEPTHVRTLALSEAVYNRARARLAEELGEGDPQRVSCKLLLQQVRARHLDQLVAGLRVLGFGKQRIDSVRPRRTGQDTYAEFEQAAAELDVPVIALIRAGLALLAGTNDAAPEVPD